MLHRITAALVLALSVTACGGGDSSSVSLPDGKGGTTKISSKGDDSKSEVTMTGDFPAFAPQYPGSTITSSTKMTTDGKSMSTVTMTSPDKVDPIIEFYKSNVTKAGMPIGMTGNFDGAGTLQAGKDETAPGLIVSATPKEGLSEISLIITNAG
jgi:hypothetical protein